MNLTAKENEILRKYIHTVNNIVAKWVPSPVPGNLAYKEMITYLDLDKKLRELLQPISRPTKWKQKDLEEQIKEEKANKK